MKLLILFVLLIAFSVLCSMIFTNPNKHSKCCEAPADQPIIGIFGVCLYLVAALIMERLSAGRPLSCGSGFIFPSGIILSGNNANINAGWSLNEKGSNGQSKFAAGCKSKKKSFRISESFFYDYFLAAIIFNASSKVSSLSLNSRGMA